ncbi:DsrE family protein [Streptomyces sp. NPDC048415]|uniref:DsrE family protein n=1 Tax=Streptomyces sp. NPDC048415 TaxID=3154822 RepID=UPI003417C21B
MTSLAIVERAYRGAVEVAYFDALFLGIEIHRQLGLDVLLRGEAVTYAVDGPAPEPFLVGKRLVETLDAPRADLLRLRDLGVGIRVEREDLAALGLGEDRLIDGAEPVAAGEFAARWPEYDRIFFL